MFTVSCCKEYDWCVCVGGREVETQTSRDKKQKHMPLSFIFLPVCSLQNGMTSEENVRPTYCSDSSKLYLMWPEILPPENGGASQSSGKQSLAYPVGERCTVYYPIPGARTTRGGKTLSFPSTQHFSIIFHQNPLYAPHLLPHFRKCYSQEWLHCLSGKIHTYKLLVHVVTSKPTEGSSLCS